MHWVWDARHPEMIDQETWAGPPVAGDPSAHVWFDEQRLFALEHHCRRVGERLRDSAGDGSPRQVLAAVVTELLSLDEPRRQENAVGRAFVVRAGADPEFARHYRGPAGGPAGAVRGPVRAGRASRPRAAAVVLAQAVDGRGPTACCSVAGPRLWPPCSMSCCPVRRTRESRRVQYHQHDRRAPEEVFAHLAEPSNHVGLSPLVVEVRDVRREPGLLRFAVGQAKKVQLARGRELARRFR